MTHPAKVLRLALLGSAPALATALWLLWAEPHEFNTRITLTVLILTTWLLCLLALHERVLRPLQTAANLLSALREGDFSIRGRSGARGDALGELYSEINDLGSLLRSQRLNAIEATALVQAVMEAIDVAVFAFDDKGCLRLANPAGITLLNTSMERVLGRQASELGLDECLGGEPVRMLGQTSFPGGSGRWGMHRSSFRERGLPHSLVVISDISSALRAEETRAWQRLVRVIGHELNNSLAPIKSIAGSLASIQDRCPRPADFEEDLRSGLAVISSRADSLARFMEAYARLARLPAPAKGRTSLASMVRSAVAVERRLAVMVRPCPDLHLSVDTAQIEQVLINLVKNAADSALEARGSAGAAVSIDWLQGDSKLLLQVTDNGQGIAGTSNLFVPFFTTKKDGSGIGLVLSRQIAENHGGELKLADRPDGAEGCQATLTLPLDAEI